MDESTRAVDLDELELHNVKDIVGIISSYIVNTDPSHYWHRQTISNLKNSLMCTAYKDSNLNEGFVRCTLCFEPILFFLERIRKNMIDGHMFYLMAVFRPNSELDNVQITARCASTVSIKHNVSNCAVRRQLVIFE